MTRQAFALSILFGLIITAAIGIRPLKAQPYPCYSLYKYGPYCYCMVNQQSGWATCRQTGPYNCVLEGLCGSGGSGCFWEGTTVATPNGPVPIELLEVGDLVLSQPLNAPTDDDKSLLVTASVTRTYKSIECESLMINGTIRVTSSHPFFVNGEWKLAGDLVVGDSLVRADGFHVRVDTVARIDRGVRVYNIEVDGTHTFLVDGILVHNKPGDPQG